MRITISGPPGSGKTTVCNLLSSSLSFDSIVFGKIFRQLAEEKNITLAELGELAEKDPAIDKSIDDRILEIAKTRDNIILESRLSAYILSRNSIPALKVYLDATYETRLARIKEREGTSKEQVMKETEARQKSEAKRYLMYYGIDISDKSVYDLIISTDNLSPEEITEKIKAAMK